MSTLCLSVLGSKVDGGSDKAVGPAMKHIIIMDYKKVSIFVDRLLYSFVTISTTISTFY